LTLNSSIVYPWLAFEALEIIPWSFDFCPVFTAVRFDPICEE